MYSPKCSKVCRPYTGKQTDRQTDRHCQILAQPKLRKRKDSLTKKVFGAIKDSALHKSATYSCPWEQDPKDPGWNR